jgi:DNA polymerase elongation subunit (family B)
VKPKVLLLDIETAPNKAYIWQLKTDYVSTDQLISSSHILCVSAKWLGESDITFRSVYEHGQRVMLQDIHEMIGDADVVVHYNGTKFDIPTLNREFLCEGMAPPSPLRQVDLLPVVRKQFKFTSNKLDYVCQQLGLGNKVHHKGMELWDGCMANDPASWKVMEKYNKMDVVLLERLYNRLLPWIPRLPNHTLYTGLSDSCPRCGSKKFTRRGVAHTYLLTYQRYQCNKCMGWFSGQVDKLIPRTKFKPIN